MATKIVSQTMFNTGEVDINVWKRTEVAEYLTAAQSLFNMEVSTTGSARKRKGTTQLLNVTGNAQFNSKLYEFIDKFGNYYVVISFSGTWYVYSVPEDVQIITSRNNFVVTGYGTNVVAFANSLTFVQAITGMPYQTPDLNSIDYTQDNDSLILTHPNYAPGRIYISQYNNNAFPTFAFQYLNIYPLPALDFNAINYNATTVTLSVTGSTLSITFAGLPAGATYTNAWVGGQIVGAGATDTAPIGYAIITAVSQVGTSVTFTATVQIPFLTSGYSTSGSQYAIKQPAWSAALGYPAKVLFFQNRLWLASTASLPNTLFGSRINSPINFDVGVGNDADAIIYTLGENNAGAIQWLNGGKQLEIYCSNMEFACPQNEGIGLTPASFSVRQQSSYGASIFLKPTTYINDSYFVNKTGTAIVNFHFTGVGLTYNSSNISAAAQHLVKNPGNRALLRGTQETGQTSNQDNFIYFLNPSDDTLTSFQFATEYKLAALTPIEFNGEVEILDIATVNNTVMILKFYTLTNQFTIEAFDTSTFMDNTNLYAMQSSGLVTGLSALNGYTVQVVYQNQDYGQYLVSNGQITVNNPLLIVDNVFIGILYDNNLIPMYPFTGVNDSPLLKQIARIYVDYVDSLNFNINGFLVPYQSFALIQIGAPLTPQTDTAIFDPFTGWNRFDDDFDEPIINISQSSPFDLQITAIRYQIASAVL